MSLCLLDNKIFTENPLILQENFGSFEELKSGNYNASQCYANKCTSNVHFGLNGNQQNCWKTVYLWREKKTAHRDTLMLSEYKKQIKGKGEK